MSIQLHDVQPWPYANCRLFARIIPNVDQLRGVSGYDGDGTPYEVAEAHVAGQVFTVYSPSILAAAEVLSEQIAEATRQTLKVEA